MLRTYITPVFLFFIVTLHPGCGSDNQSSSSSNKTITDTTSAGSQVSAPSIRAQPAQITYAELGVQTTLSVRATGTQITYQWYKDGNPLSKNANQSTYTVEEMGAEDAGTYSVKISNSAGALSSADAILRVSTPSPYKGFRPGDEAWNLPLATNPLPTDTPSEVSWISDTSSEKKCLRVSCSSLDRARYVGAKIPFDITPLRGAEILMTCSVQASNIATPTDAANGVKVMLVADSATLGAIHKNPSNMYGTFNWTEFSIKTTIPPDAANGYIYFGLQGTGGIAWLSSITITIVHPAVERLVTSPLDNLDHRNHTPLRGVTISPVVRTVDFSDLKKWKANVIRWMLQPDTNSRDLSATDYDLWLDSAIAKLDKAIPLAKTNGLRIIIDLHEPPGGRDDDGNLRMLSDEKLSNQFLRVWAKLANHYKGNTNIAAYGLVNEPVQTGFVPRGLPDWLELQCSAAYVIRKIDSSMPIILASDNYASPERFKWMPHIDIPGLIFEAHMYYPQAFTHQGVLNSSGNIVYKNVITYPGTTDTTTPESYVDKDTLTDYLQPLRDFQLCYDAQIYIGEFSAARWAQGAATYLQDVSDIIEGYNWDWSYHAFRGTQCWDLEMANAPRDNSLCTPSETPTDRMTVILDTLALNESGDN